MNVFEQSNQDATARNIFRNYTKFYDLSSFLDDYQNILCYGKKMVVADVKFVSETSCRIYKIRRPVTKSFSVLLTTAFNPFTNIFNHK